MILMQQHKNGNKSNITLQQRSRATKEKKAAMSHYKRLSIEERESLLQGIGERKTIREIAKEIQRSPFHLVDNFINKMNHRPRKCLG